MAATKDADIAPQTRMVIVVGIRPLYINEEQRTEQHLVRATESRYWPSTVRLLEDAGQNAVECVGKAGAHKKRETERVPALDDGSHKKGSSQAT